MTRQLTETRTCDQCDKLVAQTFLQDTSGPGRGKWLSLTVEYGISYSHTYDFCSWKCLLEQAKIAVENKADES